MPTATDTRLVNVYGVRRIDIVGPKVYAILTNGADGDADRALATAERTGLLGVLIVDVRTGEKWFTPTAAR